MPWTPPADELVEQPKTGGWQPPADELVQPWKPPGDELDLSTVKVGSGVGLPSQFSSGEANPFSPGNPDAGFTRAAGPFPALTLAGDAVGTIQNKVIEPAAAGLLNLAMKNLPAQPGEDSVAPPAVPFKAGVPTVPPPTGVGVLPAMGRFFSGLTTPGGLVTLPLAPESKLVQGGFAIGAASGIQPALQKFAEATTPEERNDAATELGLNVGMAALIGHHLAKEAPPEPFTRQEAPQNLAAGLPIAGMEANTPPEVPVAAKTPPAAPQPPAKPAFTPPADELAPGQPKTPQTPLDDVLSQIRGNTAPPRPAIVQRMMNDLSPADEPQAAPTIAQKAAATPDAPVTLADLAALQREMTANQVKPNLGSNESPKVSVNTPSEPEPAEPKPAKMVAAAFRTDDGRIFTGVDHMHADMEAEEAGVPVMEDQAGFVDANGKFHDREQAFKIAQAIGQLEPGSDNFEQGKLHTSKMVEEPPSEPSVTPAVSQPSPPEAATAPAAPVEQSSGFKPPQMPEKFDSVDDVIAYRNAYRDAEMQFYKSLGLSDKDASKMFRASDSRSNLDTSSIEDKLTPENRARLDKFSTGEGSEMYQWDNQYNPEDLARETDKSELAQSAVLNLARESLPNEFGDKIIHASVALRKLKENGGTWSDVARELDKYTTRNSGSHGDKVEFFQSLGSKIKDFAARQGIELPQGDLGAKLGDTKASKQLSQPTVEAGKTHIGPSQADLDEQDRLETARDTVGLSKVQTARLKELQAKNAQPSGNAGQLAKPKPSFFIRPRSDGVHDILDEVQTHGGIKTPGPEDTGGEYDGYKEAMTGTAQLLRRRAGGLKPDDMVANVQEHFPRIQSADDLYDAIREANAQREQLRINGGGHEAQTDRFWQSVAKPENARGVEKISVDQLQPGQVFRLKAPGVSHAELTVLHVDTKTGTVTVKDGPTFGRQDLPAGAEIYIRKGSLKQTEVKHAAGDFFDTPESVADQKARMLAEQKARDLKNAKADMEARRTARLTGKDLDTTGEMFGGEVKTDKSGQQSMFAVGEKQAETQRGLDPQPVTDAIKSFLGTKDLPAGIRVVRDETAPWGARIEGRNKIIVNAAQISTPERAKAVILEEGFHGVWNDPALQRAWQSVRDLVTPEEMTAERAKRKAQGLPVDAATIREEAAIARLVKGDANKGVFARVWDAARSAFKRIFGFDLPGGSRQILKDAAMEFLRNRDNWRGARGEFEIPAREELGQQDIERLPGQQRLFAKGGASEYLPGEDEQAETKEPEPADWEKKKIAVDAAADELREAIAQHTNPPAGMRKADARQIMAKAAAKHNNLEADLRSSPDYAEYLITREKEVGRQLTALLEPAGIKPREDFMLGREEKIRAALSEPEIQRVTKLNYELEHLRGEIERLPKKLAARVYNKLYPTEPTTGLNVAEVPSEWLKSNLENREAVHDAEDLTTFKDRAKDAVESLPANARDIYRGAAKFTDQLKSKYKTLPNREQMSVGKDAADNKAAILSRQVGNVVLHELNRAFGVDIETRNPMRENALSMAIEAGDKDTLGLMRDTIASSEHHNGKWAKTAFAAIDYAEKHWDRFTPVREIYKKITDAQVAAENASGIDTLQRDGGYVFHLQDLNENWAHLDMAEGGGGASAPFKHIRDHATYADAIANGVNPKTLNAIDLLQRRTALGQKLINYQNWQHALKSIIDPTTQLPLAADVITRKRNNGTTIDSAPQGYQIVHFAGQKIAIHKGYTGIFEALTGDSFFRRNEAGAMAMKATSTAKHTMLLFDSFHLGRLAFWNSLTHGAGHGLLSLVPGNPFAHKAGLTLLDSTPSDIRKMGETGEIPKEMADRLLEQRATLNKLVNAGLNVGGISDNISSDWIQKLPVAGQFNKWLFDKFQRGAMANCALMEFDRQIALRKMNSTNLTDEQVARQVAKAINIRFGNLGNQSWIKSKSFQDLSRLMMLAPQWNESLIRAEIGAAHDAVNFVKGAAQGKLVVGTLGRAVVTAAIGGFAANQMINMYTRGKPTWENPEEGIDAKLCAWIPDKLGKSAGFFLNPLTLPAEMSHLILKGYERTGRFDEAVKEAATSRLSSLGRFLETLYTGHDNQGNVAQNSGQRLTMAAKQAAPTPISGGAIYRFGKQLITGQPEEAYPGQFQRQAMQTFGIKPDSAPTPEQRMYNLAAKFNQAHGIESKEQQYQRPYAALDNAIKTGNMTAAKTELQNLLANRSPETILKRYETRITKGFTNEKAGVEQQFIQTLNPEQREQYHAAVAERQRISGVVQGLLAK